MAEQYEKHKELKAAEDQEQRGGRRVGGWKGRKYRKGWNI